MNLDDVCARLDTLIELNRELLSAVRLMRRPLTPAERAREYRNRKKPTPPEQPTLFSDQPSRGDQVFEKAWEAYPARKGKKVLKKQAKESFPRYVTPFQYTEFIEAVEDYAAYCEATESYPKDMVRFLPMWREHFWSEEESGSSTQVEVPL